MASPLLIPNDPATLEKNAESVIDCHDGDDPDVNRGSTPDEVGVGKAKPFFIEGVKDGIWQHENDGMAPTTYDAAAKAEIKVTAAKMRLTVDGPCDPNNHKEWGIHQIPGVSDSYLGQAKQGTAYICMAYDAAVAETGEKPENSAAAQQYMLRHLALLLYGSDESRQEQRAYFFTNMLSIDRSVRLGVHPSNPCD